MPLTAEQTREIAQLMFVAGHYLRLAAKTHKDSPTAMSATKDDFKLSAPLAKHTRRHTITNAHLASAAIRLASVEAILSTPRYSECRNYFNGRAKHTDGRGSTCSEWFHIMLRDAVGHGEPIPSAKSANWPRYHARQMCLEHTTFAGAYSRLRKIEAELATLVKTQHGIPRRR